jgi:hypothetical protein
LYKFRCYENEALKSKLDSLFDRSLFLQALNFAEALSLGSFHSLVAGNMLSCFAQLRLVLESLAEALIIDYRYGFGDEGVYREVHGHMHGPDGERSERCIEMCKEQLLYRKHVL